MRHGVMKLAYPYTLRQFADGLVVSFPDVPEALTSGKTREEAQVMARDALIAALEGYVQLGRELPRPSLGKQVIELSPWEVYGLRR
jgi:antitoxin HicB